MRFVFENLPPPFLFLGAGNQSVVSKNRNQICGASDLSGESVTKFFCDFVVLHHIFSSRRRIGIPVSTRYGLFIHMNGKGCSGL